MQSWDGLQAYTFPPFGLLHRVLSKVRQSRGLEMTLVAPFWAQRPCFPDLLELLVDSNLPTTQGGSSQTAPFPSLSSEPPHASVNCLLYMQRSACHFKFSSLVARQLPGQVVCLPVLVPSPWSFCVSPYRS